MISKQQLNYLRSLHQKKFRQMYGKFLVEGDKQVRELLTSGFKIQAIFALKSWNIASNRVDIEIVNVSEQELNRISTHENPDQVIAVADIPNYPELVPENLKDGLYLACDNLNDPGNAGTIIRTADWFGVKAILLSENSVDIYNPKVVNAAKGSILRVPCYYINLSKMFAETNGLNVYGTFMDSKDIYTSKLDTNAIILLGNESHGISNQLLPFVHQKISIPAFGKAESLNVGISAGIVLSEFKRRGA